MRFRVVFALSFGLSTVLACREAVNPGAWEVPDDDDDTFAGDDTTGDDDTGRDDDVADDDVADDDAADDDTGDDDSTGEPSPCDPLGPDVTPTLVLHEADWQLTLFDQGYDLPAGLAVDGDEDVLVGVGLGNWDSRAVIRIEPSLQTTTSHEIPDPDGVALDSMDQVHAAGSHRIWRLDSLMPGGGDDHAWYTRQDGGNINDMVIDAAVDDAVYLALDDGRVLRVNAALQETGLLDIGEACSIALDDLGALWVLGRASGELYSVDLATGEVTLAADWAAIDPTYLWTNRIAFRPADGRLYATSFWDGGGGTITRWDPATPDVLERWLEGMVDDDNPDDIEWHGCATITTPLNGSILRACPCP